MVVEKLRGMMQTQRVRTLELIIKIEHNLIKLKLS
jgi:hypothetical protein